MTAETLAPPQDDQTTRKRTGTLSEKLALIALVAVLLMGALQLVNSLMTERTDRAAAVAREVGGIWGGEQVLSGPMLIVPYSTGSGEAARTAVILPDTLEIQSTAASELRWRSIFSVPVYRSKVVLTATFPAVDLIAIDPQAQRPVPGQATLNIGLSDLKGIKNEVAFIRDDGERVLFEPSRDGRLNAAGLQAPLGGLRPDRPIRIRVEIELNGSRSFSFVPLGRSTSATITSNWRDPSFFGALLPDERNVTPEGFEARWKVPYLSRDIPQFSVLGQRNPSTYSQHAIGVRLYQPVGFYQLVERAIKYGVLVIGMMFLVTFLIETISRKALHPIQYLLVGLALVIFFLLLLSLSEQIGFASAYATAAAATSTLVGVYLGIAMRSAKQGLALTGALGGAYAMLYMVLRSEDYALLAGSVGAFIGLAILMLVTARLDWGAMVKPAQPQPEGAS